MLLPTNSLATATIVSNKLSVDISSKVAEEGLDAARSFLGKLVGPATEEIGLLLKDKISLWRFKNQVKMLNKASVYCELNGIEPGSVSPKLLLPLMEGAALEDDETLQDKWAILLSNLVDSEQNIQNHVFPYILGQISADEFLVLENVYKDWRARILALQDALEDHTANYESRAAQLLADKTGLQERIDALIAAGSPPLDRSVWELREKRSEKSREQRVLESRDWHFKYQMRIPEVVPEESLREFELSNTIRLGLVKHVQETYAERQTIDLEAAHTNYEYQAREIDIEIEVMSDESHVITELGRLFIQACTEKRAVVSEG